MPVHYHDFTPACASTPVKIEMSKKKSNTIVWYIAGKLSINVANQWKIFKIGPFLVELWMYKLWIYKGYDIMIFAMLVPPDIHYFCFTNSIRCKELIYNKLAPCPLFCGNNRCDSIWLPPSKIPPLSNRFKKNIHLERKDGCQKLAHCLWSTWYITIISNLCNACRDLHSENYTFLQATWNRPQSQKLLKFLKLLQMPWLLINLTRKQWKKA